MSESKVRNRIETVDRIQQAITHVQQDHGKVSISAVARAAGITPALIHNTYPDLAEKIRALTGKSTRSQRDAKHDALIRERESNRALRQEIVAMRAQLAKLASINQMLLNEVVLLRGMAAGKVVSILQTKGSTL